jgi:hypothetical protein
MLWIVKGWSGSDFVFFYSNISPLGQWSGITGEAQRNPSLKPSGLSFLFESGKASYYGHGAHHPTGDGEKDSE